MLAIILAVIFGVILMFLSLNKTKGMHHHASWMAVALAAVCGYMYFTGYDIQVNNFYDFYQIQKEQSLMLFVFSIAFSVYIYLFGKDIDQIGKYDGELYALLFFTMSGVFQLLLFKSLFSLFIGLEIVSIPLYVLAGSDKDNVKSNEAALKYFIMGAFSTGILLLGITFLYGTTGSFDLNATKVYFSDTLGNTMAILGVIFIIIAMAFKMSLVPFHFWTPDVYDGAPTAITPFMASIIKACFVYVFYIIITSTSGYMFWKWQILLSILAALTLFLGNITAVYEQSVKRMLAYSSIAQAGFMILPIIVINEASSEHLLLYFIAYIAATLGIFKILIHLKDYTYDGFIGMGKKYPSLAFLATVFLVSMAGLPVTGGFFAKLFALMHVAMDSKFIWLAVFGLLMAAVGIYYYFRPILAMFFRKGETLEMTEISAPIRTVLWVLAILIIVLGVYPDMFSAYLS